MEFWKIFKTPYMDAADDFGGGESLNADDADEGQEKDVDSQEGAGEADDDSQTNERPDTKAKQDRDTNEQFKAARLKAEREKQRIIEEREQDARDAGYSSYAEMQAYIKSEKARLERERMIAKGIDPDAVNELISNHPVVKQAQEITLKSRIATEKAAISSKPFFKELEHDIDRILAVNPSLPVEAVYSYVRGEKLDELLSKSNSDATKRAIADIHDKKSRGLTDSGDSGGSDDAVELTPEGKRMAEAFGNDPKEIAKYVKKQIRR
jgi:hypothetical protein